MGFLIFIVGLILVFSVIATLLLTRNPDEDYRNATKKNTANLTLIYLFVILVGLLALGIYIWVA